MKATELVGLCGTRSDCGNALIIALVVEGIDEIRRSSRLGYLPISVNTQAFAAEK